MDIPNELRSRVLAEHGDWYGFRMMLIGNYYSGAIFTLLQKEFGLLRDEFAILANLHDYGPMTANVICAMTGRPKNSVSRGAISLAQKQLIETTVDPDDRRHVILTITPAGSVLYSEALGHFREREAQMFGSLSAEEIEALDHILTAILERWHRSVAAKASSSPGSTKRVAS